MAIYDVSFSNELYHHGIKGQKWGVRHYQNPDGSLTEEGKRRYGKNIKGLNNKEIKDLKTKKRIAQFASYPALWGASFAGLGLPTLTIGSLAVPGSLLVTMGSAAAVYSGIEALYRKGIYDTVAKKNMSDVKVDPAIKKYVNDIATGKIKSTYKTNKTKQSGAYKSSNKSRSTNPKVPRNISDEDILNSYRELVDIDGHN